MRFPHNNENWERLPNFTEAANAALAPNTQKPLVFSHFTGDGRSGTLRARREGMTGSGTSPRPK